MLRQPLRPAAAAAAIDKKRRCNKKIWNYFFVLRLILLRRSIKFLLRCRNRNGSSSIAALFYCGAPLLRHPGRNRRRSAAIREHLYGPRFINTSLFLAINSSLFTNCSRWPRGLMDKASDSGSEDCKFESCRGRILFNVGKFQVVIFQ